MNQSALPHVLCILMLTVVAAQAPAQTSPPAAEPKQTSIAVVIQKLRHEAYDGWKKGSNWQRTEPSFAAEMNWAVPQEDVIRAMTRKLDRNPAVDAYIKHQLLSFAPDLSIATPQQFALMFNHAPMPLDAPKPQVQRRGGGQDAMIFFGRQVGYVRDLDPVVGDGSVAFNPRIGVVGEGQGFSTTATAQLLATVQQANERLATARESVAKLNVPVLAYRDALVQRGSTNAQTQLGALLKDVQDRLAAGNPTAPQAMSRLMERAPELAKDSGIRQEARNSLADWAMELAKIRTPVVTEVGLKGQEFDYRGEVLAISEDDAKTLAGYIRFPTRAPAQPVEPGNPGGNPGSPTP